MAKGKQAKSRRRAARNVRPAVMPPGYDPLNHRPRRRNAKGLFSGVGNLLLPGIGGAVGQIGDNLVGGLLDGFLGGRANSAAVATAGRFNAKQVNRSREYGSEQIASIKVPAGTPAGTILTQALIAAPTLGKRLSKFAELWTKTVFKKLHVYVTSSNPSTVPGNYTLAIDPDPVVSYESGPTVPGRLMALTTAQKANAWADARVAMPKNEISLFNKFNFRSASDAEVRQYAAGQVIMATTTDYAEDCEYTVNVDYGVEFERPDTTSDSGGQDQQVFLDTSWTSYTVSSQVVIFSESNAFRIFRGTPPAVGLYPTPGLTLGLTTTNESLQEVFSAQWLTVLDTGNVTLEVTPRPGHTLAASGVVSAQNPAPYVVSTANSLEQPRPIMVQAGYAQLHQYAPTESHIRWHAKARFEHEKRKFEGLVEKAKVKLIEERLNKLSLSSLQSVRDAGELIYGYPDAEQ